MNITEFQEARNLVFLDKTGLQDEMEEAEFHKALRTNNFVGVNHEERRQYLKAHGYNDDTYLIDRTPEELVVPGEELENKE